MTVLSFQVSDRLVEVAVEGGPLTKGEIETLNAYLAIQAGIAPIERPREMQPVVYKDTKDIEGSIATATTSATSPGFGGVVNSDAREHT